MNIEKIIEYKKTFNYTTKQLADLSGIPKGTLDKILSGVTLDPKLSTLKSLANLIGCTLNDFDDYYNCDIIENTRVNTDPNFSIQYMIKNKRKELGLTYEQFGNKVGVGKSTVRKWETGQIENIGISNVIAIAKAFNMTSNELREYNSINTDTDLTVYLKSLIQNTGLSMRAFSQKAEIPYTTLVSILSRGVNNTSILNILKICKVLRITVEELYSQGNELEINNYNLEKMLLNSFSNLNHIGKLELIKRAEELCELSKYK